MYAQALADPRPIALQPLPKSVRSLAGSAGSSIIADPVAHYSTKLATACALAKARKVAQTELANASSYDSPKFGRSSADLRNAPTQFNYEPHDQSFSMTSPEQPVFRPIPSSDSRTPSPIDRFRLHESRQPGPVYGRHARFEPLSAGCDLDIQYTSEINQILTYQR